MSRSTIRSKFGKALCISVLAGAGATASATEVLFAQVGNYGPYIGSGNQLADMIATLPGFNVTVRFLTADVYTDYADFDQVWVYDLFSGLDDTANQVGNYQNISNWYNGLAEQNLIADGRIISSTAGWASPPETAWIQNYALQLADRGGGLVLGTDHFDFQNGINQINEGIGIDPFTGLYPGPQALVDPLSPLFVPSLMPCVASPTEKCINDNSTTGFVPTGAQLNGQFLTPVAYHGTVSQAFDNAAVSSTIGSRTFGTAPEPTSLALFGIALAGLGLTRSRGRGR
jgi:hypothetical protein